MKHKTMKQKSIIQEAMIGLALIALAFFNLSLNITWLREHPQRISEFLNGIWLLRGGGGEGLGPAIIHGIFDST